MAMSAIWKTIAARNRLVVCMSIECNDVRESCNGNESEMDVSAGVSS